MKKKIVAFIAIMVVAISIGAYQYLAAQEITGTIKVSGAFALYPMMVKWAEEFQKIHPKIKIDVSAGGAGKGMTDVLGGLVDIAMVSRDISSTEINQGAIGIAVVRDAVVPAVNKNNPVLNDILRKGITKQTFMNIWVFGNVTTWGEVVGRPDVTARINVYTRSDSCGAAETWGKYLGVKQEGLLGIGIYGDPGIADAVVKDNLGIGYNNLNYAYDNSTGNPIEGLAMTPIDLNGNGQIDGNENFYGIKVQFLEAIATEAYPSPPARDLNIVAKNEFKGLIKEFMRWILTDGQQYVSQTGYIQLSSEKLEDGLRKLG
jgi:phosphate transport system substrate-binding protein